jgi:hypothetical protein
LSLGDAQVLLEELNGLGVAVHAAPDGSLRCRPKKAIGEERAERIRRHKAELLEILSQAEAKENLSSPTVLSSPIPAKLDTYAYSEGDDKGDDTEETIVPPFVKTRQERIRGEADRLGLIATLSHKYGYISVHDPTSGDWHDLPTTEAPDWAKREAFKRKELRKLGDVTDLLTRAELEELWEREKATADTRAISRRGGLLYEDYIEWDS